MAKRKKEPEGEALPRAGDRCSCCGAMEFVPWKGGAVVCPLCDWVAGGVKGPPALGEPGV